MNTTVWWLVRARPQRSANTRRHPRRARGLAASSVSTTTRSSAATKRLLSANTSAVTAYGQHSGENANTPAAHTPLHASPVHRRVARHKTAAAVAAHAAEKRLTRSATVPHGKSVNALARSV